MRRLTLVLDRYVARQHRADLRAEVCEGQLNGRQHAVENLGLSSFRAVNYDRPRETRRWDEQWAKLHPGKNETRQAQRH
jgi:hypothetical protein